MIIFAENDKTMKRLFFIFSVLVLMSSCNSVRFLTNDKAIDSFNFIYYEPSYSSYVITGMNCEVLVGESISDAEKNCNTIIDLFDRLPNNGSFCKTICGNRYEFIKTSDSQFTIIECMDPENITDGKVGIDDFKIFIKRLSKLK